MMPVTCPEALDFGCICARCGSTQPECCLIHVGLECVGPMPPAPEGPQICLDFVPKEVPSNADA